MGCEKKKEAKKKQEKAAKEKADKQEKAAKEKQVKRNEVKEKITTKEMQRYRAAQHLYDSYNNVDCVVRKILLRTKVCIFQSKKKRGLRAKLEKTGDASRKGKKQKECSDDAYECVSNDVPKAMSKDAEEGGTSGLKNAGKNKGGGDEM